MSGSTIVFEQVSKWFGAYRALTDVDLTVHEGQVAVICGPSGCGKSTLLRCINGLERIQAGRINVFGQDNYAMLSAANRAEIGFVFQKFSLYPHMTVLNNLTIGPRKIRKISRAQAEEAAHHLLARFGLQEKAHSFPGDLSGGQQQRVAIVRALSMQPKVMLFDEPTSALDPEMVREVLDVMRSLAKDGITMIIVTHEMGFAREVADLMVFMDRGKILQCSPVEQFFHAPASDRVGKFLDQIFHH